MIKFWKTALASPINTVRYDALVADPANEISAVLQQVSLNWDPVMLEPNHGNNAIGSQSRWQVRQPIYKTSVHRWKHYENHLDNLQQILQEPIEDYERSRS